MVKLEKQVILNMEVIRNRYIGVMNSSTGTVPSNFVKITDYVPI